MLQTLVFFLSTITNQLFSDLIENTTFQKLQRGIRFKQSQIAYVFDQVILKIGLIGSIILF